MEPLSVCCLFGRLALPWAGTIKAPSIACRLPGARRPPFLLPRDIHMPQPLPIKPGPSPQVSARARWHGEGSSPRQGAAAEAGEAAWHHNEAFEQVAARVACPSARIEATRSALGGLGLFEGVADALEALTTGIARLRWAWESDKPWPIGLRPRHRGGLPPWRHRPWPSPIPGTRKWRRP